MLKTSLFSSEIYKAYTSCRDINSIFRALIYLFNFTDSSKCKLLYLVYSRNYYYSSEYKNYSLNKCLFFKTVEITWTIEMKRIENRMLRLGAIKGASMDGVKGLWWKGVTAAKKKQTLRRQMIGLHALLYFTSTYCCVAKAIDRYHGPESRESEFLKRGNFANQKWRTQKRIFLSAD